MTEKQQLYGYLFQVDYGPDGPTMRRFANVTKFLDMDYQTWVCSVATAIKLGADVPTIKKDPDFLAAKAMFVGYQLSERFSDAGGTFLIKTEDPLTYEEIIELLRAKQRMGELPAFLERAKI